jgi:tripartite-type tricarboxylate transporter receptor subunit TctC
VQRFLSAALLACATLLAAPVHAQDFPTRPIRLIVPFAAGGPADMLARAIAPAMSAALKQTVVIENKAGAGGVVGVDAVAKAAPDGYTIGLTGTGAVAAAPFMTSVPYDVRRDLAPISRVARIDGVIVTHTKLGLKSLAELIAYAKANAGKVNFASAGSGTSLHLAGELLNLETGMKLVHVPYRGAAPAINDLIGGHVQVMVPDLSGVLPHIRAGSVTALAVTSESRSRLLPDIATTAEAGYPRMLSETWYGLISPAATPPAVLDRLYAAAAAALQSTEVIGQIETQGAMPAPTTADAFRKLIEDEQTKWKRVVEATGAKMD